METIDELFSKIALIIPRRDMDQQREMVREAAKKRRENREKEIGLMLKDAHANINTMLESNAGNKNFIAYVSWHLTKSGIQCRNGNEKILCVGETPARTCFGDAEYVGLVFSLRPYERDSLPPLVRVAVGYQRPFHKKNGVEWVEESEWTVVHFFEDKFLDEILGDLAKPHSALRVFIENLGPIKTEEREKSS